MARKTRHIRFEKSSPKVRSRLTWGDYYAVEGIVAPSVTFVLDEDAIAIVTDKDAVLLSPDIVEELGIMLDYISDADNQRILRKMRKEREHKDDQKNHESVRSCGGRRA